MGHLPHGYVLKFLMRKYHKNRILFCIETALLEFEQGGLFVL